MSSFHCFDSAEKVNLSFKRNENCARVSRDCNNIVNQAAESVVRTGVLTDLSGSRVVRAQSAEESCQAAVVVKKIPTKLSYASNLIDRCYRHYERAERARDSVFACKNYNITYFLDAERIVDGLSMHRGLLRERIDDLLMRIGFRWLARSASDLSSRIDERSECSGFDFFEKTLEERVCNIKAAISEEVKLAHDNLMLSGQLYLAVEKTG